MSASTEVSNVKIDKAIYLTEDTLMNLDKNGEEITTTSPNLVRFQTRRMFPVNDPHTPDLFITHDEDIECIIPLLVNFKHKTIYDPCAGTGEFRKIWIHKCH